MFIYSAILTRHLHIFIDFFISQNFIHCTFFQVNTHWLTSYKVNNCASISILKCLPLLKTEKLRVFYFLLLYKLRRSKTFIPNFLLYFDMLDKLLEMGVPG